MVGNHTLDEICLKITDGTHSTVKDDSDGNCFLLSAKNIKNGHVCYNTDTDRKISKETLLFLRNRTRTEIGDVLITTVGTIGEISSVDDDNYEFQRSVALLKPNPSIITSKFLEYSLKTTESQLMLENFVSGSVQKCIFLDSIKQLKISVPGLKIQNKIINILSSIDSLITLNSRINDYLAKIMQTEYLQMEEQYGCIIPLCDVCSFSKERISASEIDSSNYYSTENILPNKAGVTSPSSIPQSGNVTKCKRGDTIISNIRPYFKKIHYCSNESTCSTDVLCFTPNNPKFASFLYVSLYNDRFFDYVMVGSKGTKMPRGDKDQIMKYLVPDVNSNDVNITLDGWNNILNKIHNNELVNIELNRLRDLLLPKLMSGEIDVSNLDLCC